MHQGIRMAEQPNHHKYLSDLGIGVTVLLHGSSVKLKSSLAGIQSRDHHGDHFLGGVIDTAGMHNRFILVPVSR